MIEDAGTKTDGSIQTISTQKDGLPNTSSTFLKAKRDEFTVEINKKKKEDLLSVKRKAPTNAGLLQKNPENLQLKQFIDDTYGHNFCLEDVPELLKAVESKDRFQKHFGAIGIRKIIGVENPPIQTVIDSTIIPTLIEFMMNDDEPYLQLESTWIMSNLAAGTSQQTKIIIDKGVIPLFIKLLESEHLEIAAQAIWGIGNISGDSITLRDKVIGCGAIDRLTKLLKQTKDESILKQATWALSNICRGKPLPSFQKIYKAIDPLVSVVKSQIDLEAVADAIWALSYLSAGDEKTIELIVSADIVPALVNLTNDSTPITIVLPGIRILGNICRGTERQTNAVLNYPGFLENFLKLLRSDKRNLRCEVAWILSNLTAGTSDQIQTLIKYPGLLERVMLMAKLDTEQIKKDCLWALCNITNHGTSDQVDYLMQRGFMEILIQHLDFEGDATLIAVCLEALNNIFSLGSNVVKGSGRENPYFSSFDSQGGTPKLDKLQTHESSQVHANALAILENFYDVENSH